MQALHVDGAATNAFSSVDRLLADIAYQRHRERQRVAAAAGHRGRRRRRDDGHGSAVTSTTEGAATTRSEIDDEAASAYWWTDVFLRYFVFDEDCSRTTGTADSDDLLFFVRRRKNKCKCIKCRTSSQRQRRVTYDTRAYRKQQHSQQQQQQQQQKPTMLPIGDPAVLWRHTVCLNAIVHRLRYTLTVAVCTRVPRKATCCNYYDGPREFETADGQGDYEYDLQLLSRHVHTVYASTSGRRMDAAKGPRERPVYPAVCWAVDDFTEAFRSVVVRPGQTVCAELVAAWPGPTTVVEEYHDNDEGDDLDGYDWDANQFGRHKSGTKLQQIQNRAVLFAAAVPYAAVRATYECKMSLYHEAERQRRKRRRKEQRKKGGKKSSLGAALSASLTALFVGGGKDSTPSSDGGDYGEYYYGAASSAAAAAADRVEYVTVRGCRPSCDDGGGGGGDDGLSSDDFECECDDDDDDDDDVSADADGDGYDCTKGLAQMAVSLAPIQRIETVCSGVDGHSGYQYCGGGEDDFGDAGYDHDHEYTANTYYDQANGCATPVGYQQQQLVSYHAAATTSEPGDYYDYGWDYETAASSEQQTPQTPSYYYQQQQQQQLVRKRGRRRPRRLSDPCSTSIFDQLDDEDRGVDEQYQQYQQQHDTNNYINTYGRKGWWKQQYDYQHRLQQQPNIYGSVRGLSTAVVTPVKAGRIHHPHRAWSESDGIDQCGGGLVPQNRNQQKPQLLPPPPVPYYCAAEAAVSGFVQYVHKSPGGWWTRTKNKQRRRRYRNMKRKLNGKTITAVGRRRSSSASGNGCTITDDENSDDGSGSNSDHGESNSDEQDSDGEFIGALAAAAAFGQDPDREWSQRGNAGDPVADWERYDCESDSSGEPDDNDMTEWTTEILATDIRRKQPQQNCTIEATSPRIVHHNYLNFCDVQSQTPVFTNRHLHNQQKPQHVGHPQQFHRQLPLPQLRPQPLEPPPPPPALSVAFTAVACPWWTVLEDVLHVNTKTSGEPLSSNKTVAGLPLLTFD